VHWAPHRARATRRRQPSWRETCRQDKLYDKAPLPLQKPPNHGSSMKKNLEGDGNKHNQTEWASLSSPDCSRAGAAAAPRCRLRASSFRPPARAGRMWLPCSPRSVARASRMISMHACPGCASETAPLCCILSRSCRMSKRLCQSSRLASGHQTGLICIPRCVRVWS